MLVEEIKNSVKEAILKADKNTVFYFDEINYTKFPFVFFNLVDFKIEACDSYKKKYCEFKFELTYMKSKENTLAELYEAEEKISNVILPVLKIKNKSLTLENVKFKLSDKKLVMTFELKFYTNETDKENETMQTLDFSIKENKNAR